MLIVCVVNKEAFAEEDLFSFHPPIFLVILPIGLVDMFEELFGSKIVEKICFYLIVNQKCYASELKRRLELPLFGIQNALGRLEKHGVIVSFLEGKTRVYRWNPRYPLLSEFQAFISKAYSFLPEEMKEKFYELPIRKRPRRKGKPFP